MTKPSHRSGFKLIELLVVVVIIAFLIALLLPSIERVQGAAARMTCMNHMKQIGCACHVYADSMGHLPGGSIVDSAKEPTDRLGVLLTLLPYMEAGTLYSQFDKKRGWSDQKETAVSLKIYRCPIDTRPETANRTNYVAIAGIDPGAPTLLLKDKRAGAFGFDRVVRMKDIKDGTSNTIFFLETREDTGPWASAGRATLRGIDPDDETPIGQGRAFGVDHRIGEWSWQARPGESKAVMADGSVRTLTPKVGAETLSALATIAGGEDMVVMEW